jgi:hypothetical protein
LINLVRIDRPELVDPPTDASAANCFDDHEFSPLEFR